MRLLFFYIFLFISGCDTITTDTIKSKNETQRIFVESDYLENVSLFSRKIEKKADWKEPPNIIICRDSNISETRVKIAISFWERLGYSFGEIFKFSCPFDTQYQGAIYIMEPRSGYNFTLLANTHTVYAEFQDKSKEIIGAWIEIPSKNSTKKLVLEHEIGHALGFQHTSELGHIMNKELLKGGTKTTGLNSSLH